MLMDNLLRSTFIACLRQERVMTVSRCRCLVFVNDQDVLV